MRKGCREGERTAEKVGKEKVEKELLIIEFDKGILGIKMSLYGKIIFSEFEVWVYIIFGFSE